MAADWRDLRPRVLSAVAMLAVGGVAIWQGGAVFQALVVLACAAMIWELLRMTASGAPGWLPLAAAALLAVIMAATPWRYGDGLVLLLALPPVAAFVLARQLRLATALYALLIELAGLALISMRAEGLTPLLWLVAVVVISDIAGYFAGRTLGGPKFWPAISPKKTWSGTLAGWLGAALFALGVMLWGGGSVWMLVTFPLIAFAGQLGDILESWFKRRCGVKDSSGLIPGHGGVLDRFDALLTAAVALSALAILVHVLGWR